MVQKITQVVGRALPLVLDDIDTDRIIPARFLRCVTFDGLGQHAFEDDRKQDAHHPFDDARFQGASILVAGRNFGCGSSREHAPQALARWGVKAIVAESFAEIFFGNCTSMGIPCLCAKRADLDALARAIVGNPQTEFVVDLESQRISGNGVAVTAAMPAGARSALTTGNWDFLGQLLDGAAAVRAQVARVPYFAGFTAVGH